jgi:hypothetical protein
MRTKSVACLFVLITAAFQMQGCVSVDENLLEGEADPAVYREVWDRISKTGIDMTARRRELYETYRKNVEELNMERETRGLGRIEPLGYKSWTRGVESAAPTR